MRVSANILAVPEFRLDAVEQPMTNAIQRSTHAWLKALKPIGNLMNTEPFAITKLKQFFVRDAKFFSTSPQGIQVNRHLIALRLDNSISKRIQKCFAFVNGQMLPVPEEVAHHELRRLASPREEAAVWLKRVEFLPKNKTNGLEEILGILLIPHDGENIGADLTLVTSDQLSKQCVTIQIVHSENFCGTTPLFIFAVGVSFQ
jgi:hypothetical protein